MLKFLHLADLHLGCMHSSLPPDIADELAEDAFRVLYRMLRFARDEADAVLIAGDLFDSATPPPSVFERTIALFGDAGVPVFISPGNHDYLDARSPYLTREWPECVHIFDSEELSAVKFHGFLIYGCAFSDVYCHTPKLDHFRSPGSPQSVLLMHGDISNTSKYCPIRARDIANCAADYLALGHIHARSSPVQADGGTVYAYSGCALPTGFQDEGDVGAYLVTIDKKVSVEFVSFGAHRFIDIPLRLNGIPDPVGRIRELLSDHSRDLVRLTLTGVPERPISHSELNTLQKQTFYLQIIDNTSVTHVDEYSLAGIVKSVAAERGYENSTALRLALAALDGEERPQW